MMLRYVEVFLIMTAKPDFNPMSRQELRAYILANREDDEAIAALIQRGDPNAPSYPARTEEDLQAMHEILIKRLEPRSP
jgi:hypothetical protein